MPEDRSPRRRPEAKSKLKPQAPKRRRWPLILAGLSLIAVACATIVALRSPAFEVKAVRVEGVESLDQTALAQLSGLTGQSMFRLQLDDARAHLHDIPQVKSVTFSQAWPATVTIYVEERLPHAYWVVGGRSYTVDSEGVVLASGVPPGGAPKIIEQDNNRTMGPGDRVHPDALALADRLNDESPLVFGQKVRELEYRHGVGVTAIFGNGLRVTFGDERSYDYKVAVLSKLLDQTSARGITPRNVDLRFGERVTYE